MFNDCPVCKTPLKEDNPNSIGKYINCFNNCYFVYVYNNGICREHYYIGRYEIERSYDRTVIYDVKGPYPTSDVLTKIYQILNYKAFATEQKIKNILLLI